MHRAQGATGNCAIAFFLPALFYLGWAERFPRSLGPFVKGQSEAGWLRQCAKFIFLLGLFNSGSGIWGGTSILLAGHAPPPPPTPHELLTASIREEQELSAHIVDQVLLFDRLPSDCSLLASCRSSEAFIPE